LSIDEDWYSSRTGPGRAHSEVDGSITPIGSGFSAIPRGLCHRYFRAAANPKPGRQSQFLGLRSGADKADQDGQDVTGALGRITAGAAVASIRQASISFPASSGQGARGNGKKQIIFGHNDRIRAGHRAYRLPSWRRLERWRPEVARLPDLATRRPETARPGIRTEAWVDK